MLRALALVAALALAACADEDPAPPGAMTASEAEALRDAAEMIDQRRLPETAVPAGEESPDSAPTAAE